MEAINNQGVQLLQHGEVHGALTAFCEAAKIVRAVSERGSGEWVRNGRSETAPLDWPHAEQVLALFAKSYGDSSVANAVPIVAPAMRLPPHEAVFSRHRAQDHQARSAIVVYNLGGAFHSMSLSLRRDKAQACQAKALRLYHQAQRLVCGTRQTKQHPRANIVYASPAATVICDLLALCICHNSSLLSSSDNNSIVGLVQWLNANRTYRSETTRKNHPGCQSALAILSCVEDAFLRQSLGHECYTPNAHWAAGAA